MLLNCVTKFYNKHFLAAGEDLKYSESEFFIANLLKVGKKYDIINIQYVLKRYL